MRQGFERFFGYNCQAVAHNYYPTTLWSNSLRVPLDNPAFAAHQKLPANGPIDDPASYTPYTGAEYAPDLIAEEARRFVRANKDRPFLLYFPTTVPHLSLQVPEDSLAEYRGKFDETPYDGRRGYLPQRTPRAAYAAMITRMDREVGRIVELIESLGLDHDTIFVFSSDNGPVYDHLGGSDSEFFKSAGPFRGLKGSLYEGGVRVPGIVRWRDHIQPNATSDRVVGFEDWLPTILTLVGAAGSIPPGIDGIDFSPTLLGRAEPPREFLYREFPDYGGQQSLRCGDWKLVRQNLLPKSKDEVPSLAMELYNLADDVGEQHNVAAEHPEVVARLSSVLRGNTSRLRHFLFLLWTSPSQIWKRIASMPTTSGMKGGGFYDQHSSGQRSSIEILLPWVDEAAATVTLPDRAAPVTLVDYGCSEAQRHSGCRSSRGSFAPTRGRERRPRGICRSGQQRFQPVVSRFRDEGRLAAQCPGFFPMVVGGSFYAPLMPAGSVHLATTFNAVCWLDRVPAEPLPDFIIYPGPHAHRPDVHVSRSRRVFLASGGR